MQQANTAVAAESAEQSPGGFDLMERVGPYLPLLRRFAQRLTRNSHDGEDLFQDVMIKLWEQRTRVAAVELLQPWLMRVMYHQFIDRRRRADPLSEGTSIDALAELVDESTLPGDAWLGDGDEAPERCVLHMQLADEVSLAIGRLPAQQRAMVQLHDIDGVSMPEIARRMGLSINTVKSALRRARGSLRARLQPFGATAAKPAPQRRRDAAHSPLRAAVQ
jgi:RNA polymerase sigma factor (sigma-70 family)